MSRREALEFTRGDETRAIQPRRFSIVLRKPLAVRNDGGGGPKSAFKSSKGAKSSPSRGVTFLAKGGAPDTPGNRGVLVTHRRQRMRTRKGTGRSVAARTFSLVLREPAGEAEQPATIDLMAPIPSDSGTDSDASAAALASGENGSGVGANSSGENGSVNVGDDTDNVTVEIGGVVGNRGGYGRRGAQSSGAPALVNAAGEDNNTNADENNNTNVDDDHEDDDFGKGFDGGYDDGDDGGDFGGGFDDANEGGAFGGAFGATPAHGGNIAGGFGNFVDGGNDPMTAARFDYVGGKRKRPPRIGPPRPAGTPHKMERARMAKRQSLALSGAGSRFDLETEDGVSIRRSARTRTRPLQYWRGETKIYNRVHESLPTVAQMTHRTPNPAWPKNTPWHGGGAIIAVGQNLPQNSAEQGKAAGEAARRRALRLADVAHVSDSEDDDDLTEELPNAAARAEQAAALDPFGYSK